MRRFPHPLMRVSGAVIAKAFICSNAAWLSAVRMDGVGRQVLQTLFEAQLQIDPPSVPAICEYWTVFPRSNLSCRRDLKCFVV